LGLFRDSDDELTASFATGTQSVSDSTPDFTLNYRVDTFTAPNDGRTISPWRWWGAMNYYLSIIPYIGAAKAGIVSVLPFNTPTANPLKYCTTQAQCEGFAPFNTFNAIEAWKEYFVTWKALKDRTDTGYVATAADMDNLRHMDWLAHSASIKTSLSMFKNEARLMVELEREVAEGWATFVEFIAETRLNVDFPHTNLQQPILPQRILTDCDRVQSSCSPSLTSKQQVATATFTGLFHLAQCPACFVPLFNGWKMAMSTAAGQQHGRDVMEQTFQDFSTLPGNLKTIIWDYLTTNDPLTLASIVAGCLSCGTSVLGGIFSQTL